MSMVKKESRSALGPSLEHRQCSDLEKAREKMQQRVAAIIEELLDHSKPVRYTTRSLELEISEASCQLVRLYPGIAVIAPDDNGTLRPVLTLNAIKAIWELSKPADSTLIQRWNRTKWIELTFDMDTDINTLSHILEDELIRCGGYQAGKKGHWIPIMADARGHSTLVMLRWTGNGFRAVTTGSLGYGMHTGKNVTGPVPDMPLLADDATAVLIPCLSAAIDSVCCAQLKKYHDTLVEQIKASRECLTETIASGISKAMPVFGQILFLEPERQHDYLSCSSFALNDFFSLLPKHASSILSGDKVQLLMPADAGNLPKPSDRLTTPVPVTILKQYPDINYYKLTRYPVDLLKPCQSLSTIKSEVSRLESDGAESSQITKFRDELQPYIREFLTEDGFRKEVNTYALIRYMENLLMLANACSRMEKSCPTGQFSS